MMRSVQASHAFEPEKSEQNLNTLNTSITYLNTSLNRSFTEDDHNSDLFYEIKKKKGENIKFGNYSNRKDLLIKNQSSIISYIEPENLVT